MLPPTSARLRLATRLCVLGVLGVLAGCAADLEPGQPASSARPIVNGERTTDFPTTGVLLAGSNPAGLMCSGTLIGCDRFLTAAHCVCRGEGSACQSPAPEQPLRVYLQNAGFFAVLRRHVHPDYSFPDNDIAVLELSRPAVGLIPSPLAAASVPLGTEATIVGFGRSGGGQEDYGIKQAGPVLTAECPPDAAGPGHICWAFDGEGSNTCNGDSGGPLFIEQDGALAVAGVTSGGTRRDCLAGDRSYDTDVFTFLEFVQRRSGGPDALGQPVCGEVPHVGQPGAEVLSEQGELPAGGTAELQVEVPRGTSELRVALNANEGTEVAFYLGRGEDVSPAAHDCAAEGPGAYGYCSVVAPLAGTWTVQVMARSPGAYQLTATLLGGSPVAEDDAYQASAGAPLAVAAGEGVLTNDGEGALTAELDGAPLHGEVELAADGGFVYTPPPGFVGADSFRYLARGEAAAGAAEVVIEVTAAEEETPEEDEGGCSSSGGSGGGAPAALALLLLAFTLRRERARVR